MFKLKTFILSCLGVSLLVFPAFLFAADETLTITTYYPSPYGSYNEFKVASNTWLAYSSGSVGIGTTGPSQLLHIYKTGGSASVGTGMVLLEGPHNTQNRPYLYFKNATAGTTYTGGMRWFDGNNNEGWAIENNRLIGTGYLEFNIAGANKVTLDPNGNVGIGTAGPIGKLQVGNNTFSGGHGVYSNDRIGMMVNGSLTSYVYASTYNDPTYPDYGLVFIHGPSTANYNVWSISPDGPAKGDGLSFIYGANSTNIHVTTPKVYFDGNGNVGIGMTNPGPYDSSLSGPTLSVGNSTATQAAKINAGISGSNLIELQSYGNSVSAGNIFGQSRVDATALYSTGGTLYIGSNTSPIKLATNDAVRMTIDNSGNVLLGTIASGHEYPFSIGTSSSQRVIDIANSTGNETYFRFQVDVNTAANNIAYADGSWSGGGADYAEWFEREEEIPEKALVGLNVNTGKARRWRSGDPLMGVYSTNPGFIGNHQGAEKELTDMEKTHVLVALIGQVEIVSDSIVEEGRRVSTKDGQFIGWRLSDGKVFIK